ncbi:MAG: L,D-transpeptidase [Acidobacteriota bacterium]
MKMLNLRTSQAVIISIAAAFCVALSGCVANNANVSNAPAAQTNINANQSPANTNTAPAAPNPALANVPLTLPMIDALLSDEAAATELKSQAQLSDEQIQKLKDAGRDAVLQLNEIGGEDSNRSTKTSSKNALTKIREIVGADKADTVANFLRERWRGGDELAASAPNSVPTDTRIIVNTPAYRMDVFRDGKLTKSYKIGIGYPEFPLPSGLRKASEIIFNPTWTPPDEPWVKGKFAPGKKVEAGSSDNPLGPIKIPIGLPSLIHGGKQPARLGNFASHGCVGLTNAGIQDFAVELSSLTDKPITLDEINGYQKDKTETKSVKLAEPVPVELRYETIVITNDGKLTIYRDVYERGTNTEENLRRVLDAAGVSFDSLPAAEQEKIRDGLEKMAIDATGNPVDPTSNSNANTGKDSKDSAKVTRNIKGSRQIEFDIPALKGKGYPVAVNLKGA